MKEKLKKAFTSKHPRSSKFNIIIILTAFIIVLTMVFAQQILNYTPLYDTFNENTLIIGYAVIMAVILVAGFTFAIRINFKENAEYYSVKGKKRAFLIELAIIAAIILIAINIVNPTLRALFYQ